MAQIGLMFEGQWGLTWGRWRRLLDAAEALGYQSVFRSDHFTIGSPEREALETWTSLSYAADRTHRIEFGPLVSPSTFRHPSVVAWMAAAVDDLSGGRLVLGLGAGWNEQEHRQFGVPFYDKATRFEMLEDSLEITNRLLHNDSPVSYHGKHFSLDNAILLPRPQRPGGPPILIGGNGKKKTLPLAARYADEWNGVFLTPKGYQEHVQLLDELLAQNGREPRSLKRSLMNQVVIGANDADLRQKLESDPVMEGDKRIIGTPSAVVDQIGRYVDAGCERFMLQRLDMDDMDGIELIAARVLPHFHK